VTGRGTGIDDATYAHKLAVVAALWLCTRPTRPTRSRCSPPSGDSSTPRSPALSSRCGARRVPVVLDGVIAGAAALLVCAHSRRPGWTTASRATASAEPGHAVALDALGLTPLIDLGAAARRGDRSGARTAPAAVRARALRDMATFDSAGVANKDA
jgi:nicotinate-nucleotide--dimethylbenzimidazole phosphoribosyltransferase